MFMQFGELEGIRVLKRETVEEMRRIQLEDLDDAQGLLWFEAELPGRPRVIGHDGSDTGVSSNMSFDPTGGSAVLLVANGEWDEDAAEELMGKLFAEAATY